jgi:hypothetical protein
LINLRKECNMKYNFETWEYEKDIPEEPGLYILFINRPIKKLYKKDTKGILYIGKSTSLKTRLNLTTKRSWVKGYEKEDAEMFDHSLLTFALDLKGSKNSKKLCLNFPKYIKLDGLLKRKDKIKLYYSIGKNKYKKEDKLLKGHVILFGQLPPYNNTGASLKKIWNLNSTQWEAYKDQYIEMFNQLK